MKHRCSDFNTVHKRPIQYPQTRGVSKVMSYIKVKSKFCNEQRWCSGYALGLRGKRSGVRFPALSLRFQRSVISDINPQKSQLFNQPTKCATTNLNNLTYCCLNVTIYGYAYKVKRIYKLMDRRTIELLFPRSYHAVSIREKGRDLTQSYDKRPYTHRKIQKAS